MSKPRTRMLTVRISEIEYETLKTSYSAHGNSSVSALAREALQALLQRAEGRTHADTPNPAPDTPEAQATNTSAAPQANIDEVNSTVRSIDRRLGVMHNEFSRLSHALRERLLRDSRELDAQDLTPDNE